MDRYELKVSLDEIDRLIAERRFAEAAEVADTIDWTRIKSVHVLCRVSDLYKINKRYKDSRDLLEMAYEKNPSGRKIIYSLCELELKLNNYIHALQLYNAFINVAPRDPDRYLLQYKLYKKQDVNVHEQIAVLEEFLQHDFRERWAYELATLYLRAGEEQQCIRQCDEIVAYFGDGRFVIRALELKKSLTQLTPQQEERLEILKSGGTVPPPAPVQEENEGGEPGAEENSEEAEKAEDPGTSGPEEGSDASAKRNGAESGAEVKKAVAEADAGSGAEANNAVTEPEAEAKNAAEAVKAEAEEKLKKAAPADAKGKKAAKKAEAKAKRAAEKAEVEAKKAVEKADPGAKKAAEDRKEPDPEGSAAAEDAEEDGADAAEPSATPEEYTDTLLREVHMQETIARGMREIGDYDSVLAQETNGQLAMVMEEEPREEIQVEGQLDLAQIMSEWEKIRRDSEQQRLAEARRRVLEKSEAAKRELYGDDYAGSGSGDGSAEDASDGASAAEKSGTTRSWKKEDIESGLRGGN